MIRAASTSLLVWMRIQPEGSLWRVALSIRFSSMCEEQCVAAGDFHLLEICLDV